MHTYWRVILWMFLLVLVDDSCSMVSSCIITWIVNVISKYFIVYSWCLKYMVYPIVDNLHDRFLSLHKFLFFKSYDGLQFLLAQNQY
jgi:hypothetical protein